jgi:MFS family permease
MAFRRLPFLMMALLFVDFIDEFSSGVPTVGIPGIQSNFELSYSAAAFLVFTGPILVGWILEPPLFLLADRYSKKWFVCGGLLVMGLLELTIGLSGAFPVVAGALLLFGAASGAGVSLSQATLMDTYPEQRERLMARWVFMGAAGDLAAPALFWLLAIFALGWREAFVISGAIVLVYAIVLSRQSFPPPVRGGDEDDDLPLTAALRMAFRDRKLLLWLFGSWLCGLMDELLVGFGVLHLREHLGADSETRSLILMCMMAGEILGRVFLDRLLSRFEPLKLLIFACAGTVISYVAWLAASDPISSGAWMFASGLFAGSLYPIAKAQAYRALPGRSGMLNAMAHIFTPLDLALPLALGFVADRFGLLPALAILLAQPVGLFVIALTQLGRPAVTRA